MSVTAIGTFAKAALDALNIYRKSTSENEVVDGVSGMAASSIIEMGKLAEFEYITVIDESLTVHDATTDVLKYVNSLCAGWVLAAAGINTNVGTIKTVKLLGMLNPSKSPSVAVANTLMNVAGTTYSTNSLSSDEEEILIVPATLPTTTASMEASFDIVHLPNNDKDDKDADKPRVESTTGAKTASDLVTIQNLSVGQMVTLSVSDGNASKDINLNVRLITVPTSKKLLNTILAWSQRDNRTKSRIRAWRTGELKFWRDLVMMRDIFTERQRILMNDKSDLLSSMLGRSRDGMVHSVLTATPAVGTMSSVMVIGADTLAEIERREMDGRLDNYNFRQRIMAATGLMLIVVVDPISELVTVYTHTKKLASEFSIKQMKAASKGGSGEMTEILKLLNQNSMARF